MALFLSLWKRDTAETVAVTCAGVNASVTRTLVPSLPAASISTCTARLTTCLQ